MLKQKENDGSFGSGESVQVQKGWECSCLKCQVIFLKFPDSMSLQVLRCQVCLDTICSFVKISVLKIKDETVVPAKAYENRGESGHGMRTRKAGKGYGQRLIQTCVKRQAGSSQVRAGLPKKQNTDIATRFSTITVSLCD